MESIPTHIETFNISGLQINLRIITDPEVLFDELLGKNPDDLRVKDEQIPYWADLWPSSIALSRYLVDNPVVKKQMNVLELGCGLGLAGIVAGMLGGKITMTDYLPEAVDMARQNSVLNNLTDVKFQVMDWRDPDISLSADLILASDIAYEAKSFPQIIQAFSKLLNPGGKILITEPNRSFAQSFHKALPGAGFLVASHKELISFRGIDYKIHVHEVTIP